MRCPKCAADNPEGSKFCSVCGDEITLKPLPPDAFAGQPEEPGAGQPAEEGPEAAPQEEAGSGEDGSSAILPPEIAAQKAGAPVFKEVELCAVCSGAFPIGDLLDFHGKLYCPLCKAREIKDSQRKEEIASKGRGVLPQQNSIPVEAPPEQDQAGFEEGQKPDWKPPVIAFTKYAEPAGHRTYVLTAAIISLLLATLVVIVGIFLLSNPLDSGSRPLVPLDSGTGAQAGLPASPAVNSAGSGQQKKPEDKPKKPEKPAPAVPPEDDIVSYQPRWFAGTYLGPNKELPAVPADALIFMSDDNQAIYITGVLDLYNVGKKYKFRFKPTKKYFESSIINADALEVHPLEEEKEKPPQKPDEQKAAYPRKNVVLILDDNKEILGDLLGEDGENYVIREKESRGEIRIPKARILRID